MFRLAGFVTVFAVVAAGVLATTAHADPDPASPPKIDVKADGVQKIEVNHGQIGPVATKLFYSVPQMHAVVLVQIGNKDTTFPITCRVYRFAKGVDADGLAKWVNNQHSDGLFPEVPEPTATHTLPADSIKVVASRMLGSQKQGIEGAVYHRYSVDFEVTDSPVGEDLTLGGFKETATVWVKAPDAANAGSR